MSKDSPDGLKNDNLKVHLTILLQNNYALLSSLQLLYTCPGVSGGSGQGSLATGTWMFHSGIEQMWIASSDLCKFQC